jgi:hypothetical protein
MLLPQKPVLEEIHQYVTQVINARKGASPDEIPVTPFHSKVMS